MTAARDLNIYSDFEAEVKLTRKNATTGNTEAATGLTAVTFRFAATTIGAAIGSMTASASERGTTGRYYAVFDTGSMVTDLLTYLGKAVYLIVSKSGDIDREVASYRVRNFRTL